MGFRYLGFRNITREVFKSIEKITCYLSTHIECVSKTNLELGITEKLFSKDKATVVFNGSTGGVDLKKFNINYRKQWRTELRRKYGIDEKDFVYGFVGRITRDKGINELLYMMRDDRNASRRRKYRYRINEAYVRSLIIKKFNLPKKNLIYCLRPLVVGLLPTSIYEMLHKRKIQK